MVVEAQGPRRHAPVWVLLLALRYFRTESQWVKTSQLEFAMANTNFNAMLTIINRCDRFRLKNGLTGQATEPYSPSLSE